MSPGFLARAAEREANGVAAAVVVVAVDARDAVGVVLVAARVRLTALAGQVARVGKDLQAVLELVGDLGIDEGRARRKDRRARVVGLAPGASECADGRIVVDGQGGGGATGREALVALGYHLH